MKTLQVREHITNFSRQLIRVKVLVEAAGPWGTGFPEVSFADNKAAYITASCLLEILIEGSGLVSIERAHSGFWNQHFRCYFF